MGIKNLRPIGAASCLQRRNAQITAWVTWLVESVVRASWYSARALVSYWLTDDNYMRVRRHWAEWQWRWRCCSLVRGRQTTTGMTWRPWCTSVSTNHRQQQDLQATLHSSQLLLCTSTNTLQQHNNCIRQHLAYTPKYTLKQTQNKKTVSECFHF